MVDRIITAEALITAKDGTGDAFAKIGAKIAGIGKAALSSKQVEALSESLRSTQKQLTAIDKVQAGMAGFSKSRLAFNQQKASLEALAKTMRSTEAPTKKMQTEYARLQSTVSQSSAVFEKQRGALMEAKRAMDGFGVPVGKLAAEQRRLKGVIDSTTQAIERQARADQHAEQAGRGLGRGTGRVAGHGGGHGDGSLGGLIGLAVAHGAAHAAHRVIETYGEFDKEARYAKIVMGLNDAGMQPLIQQAIHGAASSRFNDVQWLESQRELAARGYNRDQVMGFAPVAAQLGQAFDISMPEGVKLLEGAMLGFKKDTSTGAAAAASAQRTADLEVKASKISGMSAEDIQAAYKFAAAPARMSGLSEEQMLAFSVIAKKANMGGEESGTAIRALGKNLLSPTAGAKVAMSAAGIDYSKYQRMPDSLDTGGFVQQVAQQYGVKLDGKAQAGLSGIFHNKSLVNNASAFMPAVLGILDDVLGGDDAKSKHKIAGLASRYRDSSSLGVDSNALMTAVMTAMSHNPAIANAIFGSKQGGRIFTAMGDPKFYNHILEELKNQSQGFAQKVSDARTEGFNANLQKLNNSMMNVDTALGRAFDGGGSGGMLTDATGAAARFAQRLAEADPIILRTGAEFAAAGAAVAGLKGLNLVQEVLGGLKGLGKGAIALETSALEATVAEGALTVAGGLTVGTLAITGAAAFALVDWLSHAPKKPRATDDPNFGNPLVPMKMPPLGINTMPPAGGGGRGQLPPDTRPYTIETDRHGVRSRHYYTPPASYRGTAPFFARGGMSEVGILPMLPVGDVPMSFVPASGPALPSLAAGRAGLMNAGTTFGGGPILEKQGPLTAKLEGQAIVAVNVKVEGPGQVTGTYSWSSGNIQAKTGVSMPGARLSPRFSD